jgi:hypothetical protein
MLRRKPVIQQGGLPRGDTLQSADRLMQSGVQLQNSTNITAQILKIVAYLDNTRSKGGPGPQMTTDLHFMAATSGKGQ